MDELQVQHLVDTAVTSYNISQILGYLCNMLHFVAANVTTLKNFVRQSLWGETVIHYLMGGSNKTIY